MLEYLRYFFNPSHLFSLRPTPLHSRAIIILAIVFSGCLIASLISKFSTKSKDALKAKGFLKLFHLFLTMGLLGYLYLLFGWQGAVLLSTRFWLLIWLAVFIVWLGFILNYLMVEVPKKRKEINQKRQFEKYIP